MLGVPGIDSREGKRWRTQSSQEGPPELLIVVIVGNVRKARNPAVVW